MKSETKKLFKLVVEADPDPDELDEEPEEAVVRDDEPELEDEDEDDPDPDPEDELDVMTLLSMLKDSPKASTHLESKIVVGVKLTELIYPRKF